jgi:hypothetical protein
MRAAFRDPGGNLWQRLWHSLARRLLGADAWGRGIGEIRLQPRSVRLRPFSVDLVDSRELSLSAAWPAARFAANLSREKIKVAPLRVAPHELPDREPDYELVEWMEEVTEPYILWDAPKPEYGDMDEYFLDDGEPVPELGLPLRSPLWSHSRPKRNRAVQNAFRDLRKQADLFTLPPDQLVRKRTSQTV